MTTYHSVSTIVDGEIKEHLADFMANTLDGTPRENPLTEDQAILRLILLGLHELGLT